MLSVPPDGSSDFGESSVHVDAPFGEVKVSVAFGAAGNEFAHYLAEGHIGTGSSKRIGRKPEQPARTTLPLEHEGFLLSIDCDDRLPSLCVCDGPQRYARVGRLEPWQCEDSRISLRNK